jgi:arabinofuranosyltransferase
VNTQALVHQSVRRPNWLLPVLALVLVLQVGLAVAFGWVGDDAYIAFRYARHLAAGEGLRFNLGESPPVEGYTQLVWVLVVAAIERLGLEVVAATRTVEIACGAVLFTCVVRWAVRHLTPVGALWTAVFFATAPGVVVWSSGGLGTMLFALVIFVAATGLWNTAARTWCVALVCVVVTLVRFDGLYFVGALLAATLVSAHLIVPAGRTREALVRRAWLCIGVVAAGFALQTLWRLGYHGDYLPNTARAKVSFGSRPLARGLDYLLAHWVAIPTSLFAVSAAPFLVWRDARRRRALEASAATEAGGSTTDCLAPGFLVTGFQFCLATFAYGVLTSGDFMAMWRFFVPAAPFVALFAGAWVAAIGSGRTPRAALVLGSALGAVLLLGSAPALFGAPPWPRAVMVATKFRWRMPYQSEVAFLRGDAARAEHWAQLGRALALHTERGQSIVAEAVGAVGYYTELTLFDRYGLVDRDVARSIEANPSEMRHPGHDTHAPLGFFADRSPTFVAAELYLGEHPGTPLYDAFVGQADLSNGRLLLFPVRAEDGFAKDGTLMLLRYDAEHARATDAADAAFHAAMARERAELLSESPR